MTVTYSLHVSKARLCGFAQLLTRWKGSIYKLLYREMIIFICLYYFLLVLYRFILSEESRVVFEKLAIYCEAFTDLIPLSFVLGFYVSVVVGRWWQQYLAIPWPDKTCMLISTYVNGTDDRSRMIRRTLARYLILMSALTFQGISPAVKKRFPTIDHLVEAGLMTEDECRVYNKTVLIHGKWWLPAQWFSSVAARARREGRIKDDILFKHLLDEMHVVRGNCGLLFSFDWITIPLVYTQVVTLAIYTYFLATVMGRQYLDPSKGYPGHEIDLYVPVFTLLKFFFYMGWLKVAEQLINPFGEDDDDFELNWCLDRNLQLAYNVVDVMHQSNPRLVKDIYWDEAEPQLPYTKSSYNLRSQPHLGSAIDLDVNLEDAEFIVMETIMEEDKDEHKYSSPPESPAFDQSVHQHLTLDALPRRTSTCSMDADNTSLSRFRLPDFHGSRLVNMILGSNRELSNSSDSMKEAYPNTTATPFILKSPFHRRKSSAESSPLCYTDEKTSAETPLLVPGCGLEKVPEIANEFKVSVEQPLIYPEKSSDFVIKIPDLSVVEEEATSSREFSTAHNLTQNSPIHPNQNSPMHLDQNSPENLQYQSSSSQESISNSDCQSITSSSHLLKNQQ